jgi:hypothetical protein
MITTSERLISTGVTFSCIVQGKRLDFFAYSYLSNQPNADRVERLAIYHNSRHAADGRLIGWCHQGYQQDAIANYINDQLDLSWSGQITCKYN